MKEKKVESWVVYLKTLHGKLGTANAVCEQAEWDAMDKSEPGRYVLVKRGIASEAQAERLARGTSGDPLPRKSAAR